MFDGYAGLQREVLDWVDDGALAGARVRGFIALAEAEMRNTLPVGQTEASARQPSREDGGGRRPV